MIKLIIKLLDSRRKEILERPRIISGRTEMAELNCCVTPHAIRHNGQEICINIITLMGYWYIRIKISVSLDDFVCPF